MLLYIFTFFAGIVTVLSPCVLPVLPAILAGGIGKGRYRPLGIIIGLTTSFAFFTLTLTYLVHLLGISANVLRYVAIGIIGLFGLVMLFPSLGEIFAKATSSFADLGSAIQSKEAARKKGFASGLLLGAALGLVWTPCAGPILAAVTTLVATQNVSWQVVLLTLTYSLGAGIPLLLIAYGGNKVITNVPSLARHTEGIKQFFGILMIATAVALTYNAEVYLQQLAVEYAPSFQIENHPAIQEELNKLRPVSRFAIPASGASEGSSSMILPKIGPAPDFVGIVDWINTKPLTMEELRGKIVLIDFWTYSCINCIRTFPYLIDWYDKYKDMGLVIVGVHTPEFEFEKDVDNIKNATERFHILYPVAVDSKYKTWQAYQNSYWPAHYLVDQDGIVRQVHFGEGAYLETENAIRTLLGMSQMEGKEEAPAFHRLITPETYLGTDRASQYAPNIFLRADEAKQYTYTPPLKNNEVGLKGLWLASAQKITSESDTSTLDLNFLANRVYLVMEAKDAQKVSVELDGAPLPKKYYTDDMDGEGHIMVHEPRKYDVINLKGDYGRYTITLRVPKGVSAYAFTFGDEP